MGIETLVIAGLVASAASGAISAEGASEAGGAAADSANYRSQVAANNAILAQRQTTYDTQQGDIQAMESGMKTRQAMGAVRSTEGANGIDVNSGTAVDLQRDVAQQGALDALTIRNNAARKAYNDTIAADSDSADATLFSSQASDAQSAGFTNSFGSILGSASSVSDKWASFQQKGIFGDPAFSGASAGATAGGDFFSGG